MSRWLLASMTTVLFVAVVIATTGFESLFADLEVISQPDATPYLGPGMVVGAAVVVFLVTGLGARQGSAIGAGLVGAAATYLVMLGVGAIGYALVHGDAAQLLVFPAGYALGPFVVGTVITAVVLVVGAITLFRHQGRVAGTASTHR